MLAVAMIALFAVTAPAQEVIEDVQNLEFVEECDDLVYGDYLNNEDVALNDEGVLEEEEALSGDEFVDFAEGEFGEFAQEE